MKAFVNVISISFCLGLACLASVVSSASLEEIAAARSQSSGETGITNQLDPSLRPLSQVKHKARLGRKKPKSTTPSSTTTSSSTTTTISTVETQSPESEEGDTPGNESQQQGNNEPDLNETSGRGGNTENDQERAREESPNREGFEGHGESIEEKISSSSSRNKGRNGRLSKQRQETKERVNDVEQGEENEPEGKWAGKGKEDAEMESEPNRENLQSSKSTHKTNRTESSSSMARRKGKTQITNWGLYIASPLVGLAVLGLGFILARKLWHKYKNRDHSGAGLGGFADLKNIQILGQQYKDKVQPESEGLAANMEVNEEAGDKDDAKKDEDKLGRLQFRLDYDFNNTNLAVGVLQAEELPGMDMCGTSDPYVKVYLMPDKKKKFETKVHRKTLNPVFNETFNFKVPYAEVTTKTLVFAVYDFDR